MRVAGKLGGGRLRCGVGDQIDGTQRASLDRKDGFVSSEPAATCLPSPHSAPSSNLTPALTQPQAAASPPYNWPLGSSGRWRP